MDSCDINVISDANDDDNDDKYHQTYENPLMLWDTVEITKKSLKVRIWEF